MEIEGKIIAVLPKQEGTSARTGNHWASQEYVLETHDQYPRKCCFRIFGEERINAMNIQAGEELRVSFDIDAREYNGRYFNTLTAWRVDRIDPAAIAQVLLMHSQHPCQEDSLRHHPCSRKLLQLNRRMLPPSHRHRRIVQTIYHSK